MKSLLILFVSFTLTFTLTGCKNDDSTSGEQRPTIASVSPGHVVRGQQDVKGRITGTNFTGIVAVDLGTGLKVQKTDVISSTEIKVVFSVSPDADPGARTVQVATTAGIGRSESALTVDNNLLPLAAFSMNPPSGNRDTVFDLDASASSDPDGKIVAYEWNFGDNQTATGKQVAHQYSSAGTFKVLLTVTDNYQSKGNSERDVSVANVRPPVARFSKDPNRGNTSTNFEFDASNSADPDGQIVDYSWKFGDGSSGSGKIQKHKFSKSDTFSVELTVTDNDGLKDSNQTEVEVHGKAPVAKFNVEPQSGDTNTTFQLDAESSSDSDGDIDQYSWKFGDGKTASGKTANHKFSSPGNYNITLTVTDNDDLSDTTSQQVNVVTAGSGGGGGGGATGGIECTNPAPKAGFIFGTIVGVDGYWAIMQLPTGSTCANSFYYCGDMRRAPPNEAFRGIIKRMKDLGGYKFAIYNDCPAHWPPAIGEQEFLYWKTCAQNYCP